jgi:hypothetical protein
MPICLKCLKTFGKFDNEWKMDEITNVEQEGFISYFISLSKVQAA